MTIRIVKIAPRHPLLDSRIFFSEALSLQDGGYDVSIICNHRENSVVSGVNVIGLHVEQPIYRRLIQILHSCASHQANVYDLQDPLLLPFASYLKRKSKAKVVYDVREFYPDQVKMSLKIWPFLRPLAGKVFEIIETMAVKHFVDGIIGVDPATVNRFSCLNKPSMVAYNFPPLSLFQNAVQADLTGIRKFVYHGSISTQRGYIDLLDAFAELRNLVDIQLTFIVANWSIHRYVKDLHSQILRRQLNGRVHVINHIPYECLPAILGEYHVGLVPLHDIPMYRKNISMKIFEYMAAGMPIIGSNLPTIRPFVLDNGAGLVFQAGNSHDLAQKIYSLVTNPGRAHQMGRNGRLAYETKYNWEAQKNEFLAFYKDLLRR